MATVPKRVLAERIAERMGVSDGIVRKIIQEFLNEIVAELARGNRLEFRDFGIFDVRIRRGRNRLNPRTLAKVMVPDRAGVKFRAGLVMKKNVGARVEVGEKDPASA